MDEQELFTLRGFKPPEVADRYDQTGVYEFDEGFQVMVLWAIGSIAGQEQCPAFNSQLLAVGVES